MKKIIFLTIISGIIISSCSKNERSNSQNDSKSLVIESSILESSLLFTGEESFLLPQECMP